MSATDDTTTMPTFPRRAARLLSREDGVTLVLALVVTMVIPISATTLVAVVTSSENTASNERQGARAFTADEAGLDLGANAVVGSSWNGSSSLPPDGTTLTGTSSVDSTS